MAADSNSLTCSKGANLCVGFRRCDDIHKIRLLHFKHLFPVGVEVLNAVLQHHVPGLGFGAVVDRSQVYFRDTGPGIVLESGEIACSQCNGLELRVHEATVH